jgi:hypothetical protein
MENANGIINDIKGRSTCYMQHYINGSIAYIVFASALRVIAFGKQLGRDINEMFIVVQILASTSFYGIIPSIVSG